MNFFDSYYEAAKRLPEDERNKLYSKIFACYYEGDDSDIEGIAGAVWAGIKPIVIKSRNKSSAGKVGGRPTANDVVETQDNEKKIKSKSKANEKQIESKSKAKSTIGFPESEKQIESHMDMDMDMDMDLGDEERINTPPIPPSPGGESGYSCDGEGYSHNAQPPDGKPKSKRGLSESRKQEVKEILDYFNTAVHSHYRITTESTVKAINARLKEYTTDDIKAVIDNRAAAWLGTDMEKYLCPETVFRPSKFEKYYNEVEKARQNAPPGFTEKPPETELEKFFAEREERFKNYE